MQAGNGQTRRGLASRTLDGLPVDHPGWAAPRGCRPLQRVDGHGSPTPVHPPNHRQAVLLLATLGTAVTLAVTSVDAGAKKVSPRVIAAINLACATYGNCATLWRRAGCETGGTYLASARNSSSGATGLYQFLLSTWNSTPYRMFKRTNPYANALAAGWMIGAGRGNEWSCR